jgi:hypothetical protein
VNLKRLSQPLQGKTAKQIAEERKYTALLDYFDFEKREQLGNKQDSLKSNLAFRSTGFHEGRNKKIER